MCKTGVSRCWNKAHSKKVPTPEDFVQISAFGTYKADFVRCGVRTKGSTKNQFSLIYYKAPFGCMDYCSTRKYSDYAGLTHPMTSRVGVDAVLSGGPPNRMAPNVTVVAGHRHQQVLRYQEHQHRLAAMHSSEGIYQQQQHGFDRYLPPVSYPPEYHQPSFGATRLSYGTLGRRNLTSPYLNPHTPLSHHLYHPPHYDSTYNGRMIGGGGTGPSALPYHPYREGYDHPAGVAPSSILHYTAKNSAFQYGNTHATQHQREYLHYYPYHPPTFVPEQYGHHDLHSINGLQLEVRSPKDDGRTNKKNGQHITESEASYAQQQQQKIPPLSSMGITMIASPLTSGSTTTDSGISGSSRCGSTPISMVTTSAGFSGEYSVNASNSTPIESCNPSKEYNKDDQERISERNEEIEIGVSSTKDLQISPDPSSIKSSPSPHHHESERTFCEQQCASRMDCLTPLISTPERNGTPFNHSSNHPSPNFQSPHRYPYSQKKWSSNLCDTSEAPSNSPTPLSPKPFSPNPNIKRTYLPECTPSCVLFEEKKNRIVECDLIPSKKSKRKTLEAEEIREEIRNIKPLPGFQQAFGSTEIGRFFETFRNIPSSPYAYESEADTLSPQSWEIENSGDGSQYDMQIRTSLQTMYKSPLGDKKYLNGIRCNGY